MKWRNVAAKIDGPHCAATSVQLAECPDCGGRAWYLILIPEVEALHAQCSKCGSLFHCPHDDDQGAPVVGLVEDPGEVQEVPCGPQTEDQRS